MTDIATLRQQAKEMGINSYGKSKVQLEEDIAAADRGERPAEREPRPSERSDSAPRARRIPMGVQQLKLEYPSRPGYVRRWFNDSRTRLQRAEQAGYEFVTENVDGRDTRVSRLVGTNEDGSPMSAYLMEIRQEFYDEDQAAKQRPLDEFEAEINNRAIGQSLTPQGADAQDAGHYYQPSDDSSIRRGG